jgi:hypothetical protein
LYQGQAVQWHGHLVVWLTTAFAWAFLTPFVWWLASRFPVERKTWWRRGELLRQTLAGWQPQEVPLRRKVELIHLYLDIQRVRFEDRLTIEMNFPPATLDAAVPGATLDGFSLVTLAPLHPMPPGGGELRGTARGTGLLSRRGDYGRDRKTPGPHSLRPNSPFPNREHRKYPECAVRIPFGISGHLPGGIELRSGRTYRETMHG